MRTVIEAENTSTADMYKLLTTSVVPRPIAWVSSRSPQGVDNLSPYSFYTVASSEPPIVQFTSLGRKDSWRNATDSGEFVINLAPEWLTDQINRSSAPFPPEVSEFEAVGIEAVPATHVDCLRVRDSPIAIECVLHQTITVGNAELVLGRVVAVTVDSERLADDGLPDFGAIKPMARLGRIEWGKPGEVVLHKRPS